MRVAVIGDMHCGHLTGIAPPNKQHTEDAEGLWRLFVKFNKKYGPFDAVFVMGDTIDGKGQRSGGVELITTDCMEQADIAISVLDKLNVRPGCKWFFTGGTPYHTGNEEDFERIVVSSFKGEHGDVVWPVLGKHRFRLRHKINRAMNNLEKQMDIHCGRVGGGREPQADMLLFGHLHQHKTAHRCVGGKDMAAVMCPAMQGHTGYGGRQCDSDVDIGMLCLTVTDAGITINKHIAPLGYDTWGGAKMRGMI
jgi:hypothetical protein